MDTTDRLLGRIKEIGEKERIEMQVAVQRLKKSREAAETEERELAVVCGKEWAMKEAEWNELVNVAALDESDVSFARVLAALECDGDYLAAQFGHDSYNGAEITDAEAAGFVIGARIVKDAVDAAA